MKAPTAKAILEQAKDTVAAKYGYDSFEYYSIHRDHSNQLKVLEEASLLAMERIAEMSWKAGSHKQAELAFPEHYPEGFPDKSTCMNNLFPKI